MNVRSKPLAIWLAMLCMMLLISACSGNNGSNAEPSPSEGASSPAASPSSSPVASPSGSAAPAFPRTVTDAFGEVTIDNQPTKIALVHWGLSDILLTFDLKSVGIALPFTYEQSVLHTEPYQPYVDKLDELQVVGENTTVNLEGLLAYDPDIIIAGTEINKDARDQLNQIAPTYFIDEAKTNVWEDWRGVMRLFGEVLGQEKQAEAYIAAFDAKVAEARGKLTGVEGNVAFVQVREKVMYLQGTNYTKLYYDELGLKPPETAQIAEGGELSLEGLSDLNPDHLFLGYFNMVDTSIPAITDEWSKSEVWKSLGAVKNGQAYSINGELALGYGPIGRSYGIDAIVEALQ